jgi:hypothetical protein
MGKDKEISYISHQATLTKYVPFILQPLAKKAQRKLFCCGTEMSP